MSKRERISLRLDAEADSIEGQLLNYLKHDPAVASREAIIRALKAFYLLWALEKCRSKDELKLMAKTLSEELQFRILQIHQHFLAGELIPKILSSSTTISPASDSISTDSQKELSPTPPEFFAGLIDQADSSGVELDDY